MTQEQSNNSKLLWGLIVTIAVVIALFVAFQWLNSDSDEDVVETPTTMVAEPQPEVVEVPAPVELQPVASEPSAAPIESVHLVNDDVLKAPVPESEVLAKEEVSKLEDIQSQLNQQEKTLKEQHATADDLIKLKEEQIALLEAQLATSKNS